MKKKTPVHAFSVHDVNSTTKAFWASQQARAKLTLVSDIAACKSLIITVNKETVIPVIHAGNLINRT
jgi:hypothetical protein